MCCLLLPVVSVRPTSIVAMIVVSAMKTGKYEQESSIVEIIAMQCHV